MAEVIKPVTTINHIPVEIIEMFAPDLQPKTISTLRQVNKHFWQAFSKDRYYRRYLCYPHRISFYNQDLEEIGNSESRWRDCLEAEKRRLENWRNGRFSQVDIVEIPARASQPQYLKDIGKFYGLIDQDNEYWMLIQFESKRIVLLNYTRDPIFAVHDLSSFNLQKWYEVAHIAPGQVVIGEIGMLHVFNYSKNGDSVSIEYYFNIMMPDLTVNTVVFSGKSRENIDQNLLLCYKRERSDGILRVWDIKLANELESLSLSQFTQLSEYFASPHCSLRILTRKYPNVIVIVSIHTYTSTSTGLSAVAVVNLEERRLTHCIGQIDSLELQSSSFSDRYVALVTNNIVERNKVVKLYDFHSLPPGTPKVIFQFKHEKTLLTRFVGPRLIIDSPFFDKREDILAIRILGSEIVESKIEIPNGISIQGCNRNNGIIIHSIIGPYRIFMKYLGDEVLKTFDEHGNELFDWETKLQEHMPRSNERHVWFHALRSGNLFKCLVENRDGKIVIFTF